MSNFFSYLDWVWQSEKPHIDHTEVSNAYSAEKEKLYTSIEGEPFLFFKWFFEQNGWQHFLNFFLSFPTTVLTSVIIQSEINQDSSKWLLKYYSEDGIIEEELTFQNELSIVFEEQIKLSKIRLAKVPMYVVGLKKQKDKVVEMYLANALKITFAKVNGNELNVTLKKLLNQAYETFLEAVKEMQSSSPNTSLSTTAKIQNFKISQIWKNRSK